MNKGKAIVFNILAALAATAKYLSGSDNGVRSRTPQIGKGIGKQPKFRPKSPNGKWVMKHHRRRHKR